MVTPVGPPTLVGAFHASVVEVVGMDKFKRFGGEISVSGQDLAATQKTLALYELAQDYLKAGLLDRAEELFLKLEHTAHAEPVLKFLLEIYEQEGCIGAVLAELRAGRCRGDDE